MIIETEIEGVVIIERDRFSDTRGFFETLHQNNILKECGINTAFVQSNHSKSSKDVFRGLHYQLEKPQAKLVTVIRGAVIDFAVDIRVGSPTYSKHVVVYLSEYNKRSLYIPEGFAHGFFTVVDNTDFIYQCGDYYNPGDEYGVYWLDPDINLDFTPRRDIIISEKDEKHPMLKNIPLEHLPKF